MFEYACGTSENLQKLYFSRMNANERGEPQIPDQSFIKSDTLIPHLASSDPLWKWRSSKTPGMRVSL